MRFAAAIFVVLYHTLLRPDGTSSAALSPTHLVDLGYTAVGLFFVLSGFILATVYPELADLSALRRFWLARFARIYPTYALSLLLDLPRLFLWRVAKYGVALGSVGTAVTLGSQFGMIQVWLPQLGGLNYPSWSVATEIFFYLAFPALLPVFSRLRGVAANLAALAAICGTGITLCALATIIIDPASGWLGLLFERNPIFRLSDFASGMVLANLHRAIVASRDESTYSRLAIGCLAAGLLGFGTILWLAPHVDSMPLKSSLLIPSYSAIILGLALARNGLARVLSLSPLLLLGEASYALYLIHAPVWMAFGRLGLATTQAYFFYLLSVLLASVALHVLFERPLRRAIVSRGERSRVERLVPQISDSI